MAEADTETDDKYSNGKIYRLDYGELTYIGSTIKSLKERERGHRKLKSSSKALYERAKADGGTVIITLIEDYPCESKTELTRREGYWQQQIGCVNRRVAGRTQAEYDKAWYEANKVDQLEYLKARREALPTVICDCGGKYKQYNQWRHTKSKMHLKFVAANHSEDVS